MSGDLVLVTGATGFLGYLVLIDLLKHGYKVRATVRSEAKANRVRNAPSLKALNPSADQLSFVSVPDMAAPGAFTEAVRGGVKYVVHCASPIPSFGEGESDSDVLEREFVKKSERGALELLEAAAAAPGSTVKRFVLTSTIGAILPLPVITGQERDPARLWSADDRTPPAPPPYGFELQAYTAGKAQAVVASEAFMSSAKRTFDLVTIFPPWVWARDELTTDSAAMLTPDSSNAVLLSVVTGFDGSEQSMVQSGVHGEDVAHAHVAALNPAVKGNQSFVVTRDDFAWEDAIDIAKKHFPEAFASGKLKAGKRPSFPLKWDTEPTVKQLGIRARPFEDMVTDVVGQYLELLEKEGK